MTTFEKRPDAPDWIVNVWVDDEIFGVSIFGAKDEAQAIRDALSSFAPEDRDGLIVISVTLCSANSP